MISRNISEVLLQASKQMPVLVITGPRQSGKTTVCKITFPDYDYVNLELPAEREFAENDPQSFLLRFKKGVIIDEIQYSPKILSYIQVFADKNSLPGQYILTGSQNFNLMHAVSQSLAGRAAILKLLPFSSFELRHANAGFVDYESYLFTGFYPRIYDMQVKPFLFYQSYIQTYVERDIRQLLNVKDLNKFRTLLKLLTGRVGQLLNYNSLANETGIDTNTVKSWISILETSYIVYLLYPYYNNFGKRVVKSPKLYFLDTGLLCNLLGLENKNQLITHYLKGEIFENFVLIELLKQYYNKGIDKQLYFWRDSNKNEVDLIIEQADTINAAEIKSGRTINSSFFKGLHKFDKLLSPTTKRNLLLIYGADETYARENIQLTSWKDISEVL